MQQEKNHLKSSDIREEYPYQYDMMDDESADSADYNSQDDEDQGYESQYTNTPLNNYSNTKRRLARLIYRKLWSH